MRPDASPLRHRIHGIRDEFIERMQRYYFRYNIDIPGVLTSIASISMVCIALTFVFNARG